jgi:ATP-dependent Clp protease ATP-binding subunit ClpC
VPLTYEVAQIVYHTQESDLTESFAESPYGFSVLNRLGLDAEAVSHFLSSRKNKIASTAIIFPGSERVTGPRYARAIFKGDAEFAQFLFTLSVQEKEFIGAAEWVSRLSERRKRQERWWGKDQLGKIPGIGKSWAYGQIFTLKQYSEEFEFGIAPEESTVQKEIEELEGVLARSKEANALIVADPGTGEMNIVYGLVGKIQKGTSLPSLEGKRVFKLNVNAIIDAFGEKAAFEKEFLKVLTEAQSAGNIILVIADLPGVLESARSIGSEISGLMYPFLVSSDLQVIGVSGKERFHESIERNVGLMNAFEVVRLEQEDEGSVIFFLEEEILRMETRTSLFFTYQAVQAIAESAARFFSEGSAIDKAKDLMLELPAVVRRAKRNIVLKADVLSLVEAKTGVPAEGVVKKDEQQKLLNLEAILHQRVIGQEEAIIAISNAMRRARAGLRNPNKPIGSFLFLGPTGVGKTETAKALSETFFGAAAPMLRLDMSEYAGADALSRLIGSYEAGRAGVLASMLRDQKYGVLLLDEFEKTTPEVMNLFLQILDEGFFSDMLGKKVSARNVIVIATSNAGSDVIFKSVQEGKNLENEKSRIIDALIARASFKPELLNRFDGVILFHPLTQSEVAKVAVLLIDRLSKLMKEQGVHLQVTDDLVHFIAEEGYDPKFGARPMQRVLQESVEKLLAEKMIRGDIRKGATVELVTSATNPTGLEVRAVA